MGSVLKTNYHLSKSKENVTILNFLLLQFNEESKFRMKRASGPADKKPNFDKNKK